MGRRRLTALFSLSAAASADSGTLRPLGRAAGLRPGGGPLGGLAELVGELAHLERAERLAHLRPDPGFLEREMPPERRDQVGEHLIELVVGGLELAQPGQGIADLLLLGAGLVGELVAAPEPLADGGPEVLLLGCLVAGGVDHQPVGGRLAGPEHLLAGSGRVTGAALQRREQQLHVAVIGPEDVKYLGHGTSRSGVPGSGGRRI